MRRCWVTLLVLLLCVWAPGRARAQASPMAVNAQLFRPAIGPEDVISVVGTRTPGAWRPMAHLILEFGYRLVYLLQADGSLIAAPVETMTTAHLMGGLGLTNWLALSVDLPVVLYQSAGLTSPLVPNTPGPFGVGDLRLAIKLRLRSNDKGGFGVALVPQATFPSGSAIDFRGSSSLSGAVSLLEPRVAVDYRFARGAFVAVNAGFEARLCGDLGAGFNACDQIGYRDPATMDIATEISHSVTYGVGAYVPIAAGFGAAGELLGKVSLATDSSGSRYLPLEAYLAGRWIHKSGLTATVGGGALSPIAAAGAPLFRLFAGVGYLPYGQRVKPPSDRDHDGILDQDDACPDEAGPKSPEPWKSGCPQDSDEDGVVDGRDQCPEEPQGQHPDRRRPGCPLTDKDEDGVYDDVDLCPDVPGGEQPNPRRPGCPLTDKDEDGVADDLDQCVDVPAGPHLDPRRPGCPDGDRDGDGILDSVDACPTDPGPPSPDPKRSGCPTLASVKHGMIVLSREIYFATGTDVILPVSAPVLQAVADLLWAGSTIKKLSIEGHTDNRGSRASNLKLSQRRAAAVRRWLVSHKVSEDRLEARGYGPDRPIANNQTLIGRGKNRRVDFRIIDPPQPPGAAAPPPTPAPFGVEPGAAPPLAPDPAAGPARRPRRRERIQHEDSL